jgi:hypothetical protein
LKETHAIQNRLSDDRERTTPDAKGINCYIFLRNLAGGTEEEQDSVHHSRFLEEGIIPFESNYNSI